MKKVIPFTYSPEVSLLRFWVKARRVWDFKPPFFAGHLIRRDQNWIPLNKEILFTDVNP